jgi:uncharacterized cupin superfamily protein
LQNALVAGLASDIDALHATIHDVRNGTDMPSRTGFPIFARALIMSSRIMNIADIELQPLPAAFAPTGKAAERFGMLMGAIAPRIGAQKLGYNLTAIPPGKRAFPFHNHRVNEEMFFILEGTGEVRIGDACHPIRAGDIIACPPGGADTAHQIINTGTGQLKFLAVSTAIYPEVAEYPDSGKFAVRAENPMGADGKQHGLRFVGRADASIDYWDGE